MIQEPGLQLDDRQRAMLEAMHIKVWQPPARSVAVTASPPASSTDAIKSIASDAMNTRNSGQFDTQADSANASRFRWKLVAGLASLSAVAFVGWGWVGGLNTAPPISLATAPAAPASAVVVAAEQPQIMIRDPRLDELLTAHKQFGGTSALQMPAGFLRNATFEVPNR